MGNNSDEQRALILLDGQGIEEPAVEGEERQKDRRHTAGGSVSV